MRIKEQMTMAEISGASFRRKQVLMVCYYYPPIQSSGTARSLGFSQNLQRHGWDPVVLTVQQPRPTWIHLGAPIPDGIAIERSTEFNLFRFVNTCHGICSRIAKVFGSDLRVNFFEEMLCVPDAQIAWLTALSGLRLARRSDLIYVSCAPFSSALSGCILKLLTGKPLVLDFRDAWTLNPHLRHTAPHRKLIEFMERAALRCCDSLVVNTAGAERLYRQKYPQWKSKIMAIPNGYDGLNLAHDCASSGPLTIMHVGNFYGSRQPDALLEALAELKAPDIEFVQVGDAFPSYAKYKDRLRLRLLGPVDHATALETMRTASVLYLKQGHEAGIEHYIAVAAKTYEYLATGLPIIADCPPGDNIDLVAQYSPESYTIVNESSEELKAAVLDSYTKRNERRPVISESFAASFSRESLTARLASLFDALLREEEKEAGRKAAVDAKCGQTAGAKLLLLIFSLLSLLSSTAFADIVRYQDSAGQVHYTNSIEAVPEQYREQLLNQKPLPPVSKTPRLKELNNQPRPAARSSRTVEVFVADWCGYCRALEKLLKEEHITYRRMDIEKSAEARRRYQQLGSGGIPITQIGSNIIRGYRPDEILAAVGKQQR